MAKLGIFKVAVLPRGDVYSPQTGGHIVRHGNPLKNDSTVEIVYKTKERLDGLSVSPSGALYAVGKQLHTNAGGQWRREPITAGDDIARFLEVRAFSDEEIWVGSTKGEVLQRKDGKWQSIKVPLSKDFNFIYAINGTSDGRRYVTSDKGVAVFDGKKWQKIKMPKQFCYLDVVLPTGATSAWIIYRGLLQPDSR